MWATSRRTEKETKRIARNVFAMPRQGIDQNTGSSSFSRNVAPVGDLGGFEMLGTENMNGFEDLSGGMDYLNMLEHVSRVQS